ncbi:hypothetical protein [Flavonifractor sp. AGMB03687]|uniref:hypothetical protein n=1 Tax=Flavonifractor sp. AGMB03687 TaxID=2785133 RepID=UPI001ADF2C49|nr:hypothetical protein [Flavonifractor sp. AGMB03687]
MCNAPFRKMFALIVLDDDADLPQHLLVDLADRCSQRPNRGRGIEIEDCHKVLVLEVAFRLQTAAGHQGIGDADSGRRFELDFDVEIIVFLQERTVNNIAEVLLMLVPILTRQLSGHIGELLGEIVTGNTVVALKHGRHRPDVLFLQLPQPGGTGMFTGAGIGNIEHIAQPGSVARIVHQGDTLGTAPHIPAHLLVPQIVLGTGGGVRALGVNHHLLMERIFVEAGSRGKKGRPFLPAAHKPGRYLFGHLPVKFSFGWHGFLSSFHVK